MNKLLREINDLYLQVQDYIDPAPDFMERLLNNDDPHALQEYREKIRWASDIYQHAHAKLVSICDSLSPIETIEGYGEGCRLLRKGLSGYMVSKFDRSYIPLMAQEIRNPESLTAFMFVQSLADQLGLEAAPIILDALKRADPRMRERALVAIQQLAMIEAIPVIEPLIYDENELVATKAKDVLNVLHTKR